MALSIFAIITFRHPALPIHPIQKMVRAEAGWSWRWEFGHLVNKISIFIMLGIARRKMKLLL